MKASLFFMSLISTLLFEEGLHEFAAVRFEDAGGDGGLGMEGVRGEEVIATLIILTAVDDARDLRPADGAGTHRARLHGDVEGAVGEVLAAEGIGSGGDSLHLGMGRDVTECFRQVVAAGHDALPAHHDAANGDFARIGCLVGFVEC